MEEGLKKGRGREFAGPPESIAEILFLIISKEVTNTLDVICKSAGE